MDLFLNAIRQRHSYRREFTGAGGAVAALWKKSFRPASKPFRLNLP